MYTVLSVCMYTASLRDPLPRDGLGQPFVARAQKLINIVASKAKAVST